MCPYEKLSNQYNQTMIIYRIQSNLLTSNLNSIVSQSKTHEFQVQLIKGIMKSIFLLKWKLYENEHQVWSEMKLRV